MTKRSGVVHQDFECQDCGWRSCNYKNASACAANHAKATGHYVHGEIGIFVAYNWRKEEFGEKKD